MQPNNISVVKIFFLSSLILLFSQLSCLDNDVSVGNLSHVNFGLVGTPDILDIPYFIAHEKGFFNKEGLDVSFIALHGDSIAIQSLISNDVDVVSAGIFSIILAVSNEIPIRAFVSIQNTHDYFLAVDSKISNVQDLRGESFGIYSTGDITEILCIYYLSKFNINRDDVIWLSIGGSADRLHALLSGRVSAAPLHSDLASIINSNDNLHILASLASEVPMPMSAVCASTEYIAINKSIVRKLTTALINACNYAILNKEDFLIIASKHLSDLDTKEISDAYDYLMSINAFSKFGGLDRDNIERAVDALIAMKEIDSVIDATLIVTREFISGSIISDR